MTAPAVPDCLPEFLGDSRKVIDEGIDVQRREGFVPFQRRVEIVYVSLMMLAMVNFHGPAVEVRFERIG